MWNETVAWSWSDEVVCLITHKKCILQQLNWTCIAMLAEVNLAYMWMHILCQVFPIHSKWSTTSLWFLDTYFPNNSVESARNKVKQIYLPTDWERVVAEGRRKNPFTVSRTQIEDFVLLKVLKAAIVNRKVTVQKDKVEWLKMHWIQVDKDNPLEFRYRCSHNTLEVWKTVSVKHKTNGRTTPRRIKKSNWPTC